MRNFSQFTILLILISFGFNIQSSAQAIVAEQVFPVKGYSIFETGYPLKVSQSTKGKFTYLEFWRGGEQGRRSNNIYLQNYGTKDYIEYWFKPVTDPGLDLLDVTDLYTLTETIAVIGQQVTDEAKETHTMARFFNKDGKPLERHPVQLSTYVKKPRRFDEQIVVSPKKRYMLWMGIEDEICMMSLWDGKGENVWEKELEIPYFKEKYTVKEVRLNDRGEVFFLMEYSRSGGEQRPLIVHKLLPEQEEFITTLVHLAPEMKVINVQMEFSKDQGIILAGALAGAEGPGIQNGEKIGGSDLALWTHLFLYHYEDGKDELTLKADSISAIPKKWVDFFAENGGSNLKWVKLLVDEEYAALCYEEHFEDRKKIYFYNVAIAGFNTESGEVLWSQIIRKRQRDQSSDRFLSYVSGVSRGRLRVVYLTERGARGRLLCTSINMEDGKRKDKMLASNEAANYLFFPSRSGMVSNYEMVLIGMGNPSLNDYKLITIAF